MLTRITILSICLVLSAAYVATASRSELVPPRQALAGLPLQIEGWKGQDSERFSSEILAVLGTDEYLNRVYQLNRNAIVGLYIGYYESQRQGDTIHSPLNCLPGSGWEPVSKSYLTIPVVASGVPRAITVNRYVVEKGLDRTIVLYWYQSHGRVVANEYRSKVLMVYDAFRLNRTDAALVRVIAPIVGQDPGADTQAEGVSIDFVKSMFPLLDEYLPS